MFAATLATHPHTASTPSLDFAFATMGANPAPAQLPHTPHVAHPIPLREQAFTLHCQGLRSPAISRQLGVPERTIRSWIASALDELKDDHQCTRREQLLLAVERQHAFTVAAWEQFEAETAVRAALLDAALTAANTPTTSDMSDTSDTSDTSAAARTAARPPHLPATTPAPRYLSLILQANKETNRLLGLYTVARLDLLTSEPPDPVEPADRASAPAAPDSATLDPQPAAESATPTSPTSATPSTPPCSPTSLCACAPSVSSHLSTHIAAESATATPSRALSPSSLALPRPPLTAPPCPCG